MSASSGLDCEVAVIGGGVVGSAVTHALAKRGVAATMLEAESELALGASGTNSGILHTGFDSKMGELETELILRAAALREQTHRELSVPELRCGAVVEPRDSSEREAIVRMAEAAGANGVEASVDAGGDLRVPGESVTDPAAYTNALAQAAADGGAEIRTGTRVRSIEAVNGALRVGTSGDPATARAVVNCAGLRADEVAGMAGDRSFYVYPRKGEFFVFDPPDSEPLDRILLPVPTERTKGVLVFPTLDGKVVAGPTAVDGSDKDDWSVRPEAWPEVMEKVVRAYPPLEGAEPIASYAGLRPAGRGVNYVIGQAHGLDGVINVAAIRSTGLSASLGIGAYVAELLARMGIEQGPERELRAAPPDPEREPWWKRASRRAEVAA